MTVRRIFSVAADSVGVSIGRYTKSLRAFQRARDSCIKCITNFVGHRARTLWGCVESVNNIVASYHDFPILPLSISDHPMMSCSFIALRRVLSLSKSSVIGVRWRRDRKGPRVFRRMIRTGAGVWIRLRFNMNVWNASSLALEVFVVLQRIMWVFDSSLHLQHGHNGDCDLSIMCNLSFVGSHR